MATVADAARLALALPGSEEVTSHGHRGWAVAGRRYAWERPFTKADLRRYGDEVPPAGPILALATGDLHERAALLAAYPGVLFVSEHFAGYPAVLLRLAATRVPQLRARLLDAWLTAAPPELAAGRARPRRRR